MRRRSNLLAGLKSAFGRPREGEEIGSPFARMRFRVLLAFAFNLLVVGAVVFFVGARAFAIEIWYQPSFPSNLLIVRNDGAQIQHAIVVLDGRFRVQVAELVHGVNGFEVERQFRDEQGHRPTPGYRPRRVTVEAGGESMSVSVETREP